MEDFQGKDQSIIHIYNLIVEMLGKDTIELVDYWEADLFAIGFKRSNKLVYISTWSFTDSAQEDMKYYSEFEVIDEITSETISISSVLDGVSEEMLLKEVNDYLNG